MSLGEPESLGELESPASASTALETYLQEVQTAQTKLRKAQARQAKLWQAIKTDDLQALGSLNQKDINMELTPPGGVTITAVQYAAREGLVPPLCVMLSAGCDVNQTASSGQYKGVSALQIACRHPDQELALEMVRKLLAYDADVNTADRWHGATPLSSTVELSRVHLVRLLCDWGADVNREDSRGHTPLTIAAGTGCAEIVSRLCAHGADANKSGGCERTPLTIAIELGHVEVVRILCARGADANQGKHSADTPLAQSYSPGKTPLQKAVEKGDAQLVRILCTHGADVNRRDFHGRTPLMTAAQGGPAQVAHILCAHGADVNRVNYSGRSALVTAAEVGRADIVRILCEHGADVSYEDQFKRCTALISAARAGHARVVKVLCAHGADVNRAVDGRTPLVSAVTNGHVDVVASLCNHQADVNKEARHGVTPLICAVKRNLVDVVRCLCANGASDHRSHVQSALMLACTNHYMDVVEELLKSKVCYLNKADQCGNRMLHYACFSPEMVSGCPDLVRLLLAQPGCHLHVTNSWQETALQHTITGIEETSLPLRQLVYRPLSAPSDECLLARARDFLQIVEMLVRAGCPVGTTPSPLKSLLNNMAAVLLQTTVQEDWGELSLAEHFSGCVRVLLSAGCPVQEDDWQILMNPSDEVRTVLSDDVIEYATCMRHQTPPASLKRLCKFAVRRFTRKPLGENLPKTGLPQLLQRYSLLEIND